MVRVQKQAQSIVQNQIAPAAQQVVETGKPIVINLGKATFKLTIDMARELLNSNLVKAGLIWGFMLDNTMAPENWSQWSYRVLVTGEPPPQFSQYDQWLLLLDNMAKWGLWGARQHMSTTWVVKLGKMILRNIESNEGLQLGTKKAANIGPSALQGLYNMHQLVNQPQAALTSLTLGSQQKESASESE